MWQSSWTKRAIEVDSHQPMSPRQQLAGAPDSTCARVIHSRPEAFGNNWVPVIATREREGQDDEFGMHGSACSKNKLTFHSDISLLFPTFYCFISI
jgi:hypothetical protein